MRTRFLVLGLVVALTQAMLVLIGGVGSVRPAIATPTDLTGRCCMGFTYDELHNKVVMFGGNPDGDTVQRTNETWTGTINGGGSSITWTQATPTYTMPALNSLRMVYYPPTDDVILFGGEKDNGVLSDQTYMWNGSNWANITPATSPAARISFGMAYDNSYTPGRVVIYGGSGLVDTWTGYFDTGTSAWVWEAECGTLGLSACGPGVRGSPAMAGDTTNHHVLLFGGKGNSSNCTGTGNYCADAWMWDPTTSVWDRNCTNCGPSGRQNARMTFDSTHGKFVMFGGDGSAGLLSDTGVAAWNGSVYVWTSQSPSTHPSSRCCIGLTYDPDHDRVALFGGQTTQSPDVDLGDTWFGQKGSGSTAFSWQCILVCS